MEQILVNLTGGVRRERLDGRDYLVAPASLIVPGVLNGSKGPILYQLEDIEASAAAWNGMPIVVNHPTNDQGQAISARHPKVLEQFGIGQVFNTKVDGKLVAEAWFDVEKTRKVDVRILNALQSGKLLELSTGLNLDAEPSSGVWNDGKGRTLNYQSIARRYRPDHLAILPDQQGACSLNDGCGIGVNSENGQASFFQKVADAIREGFAAIKGQQTAVVNQETSMEKLTEQERKGTVDFIVANCDCWKETDRETLNKMEDRALVGIKSGVENSKKLKEQEAVVNAARTGVKVGEEQFVLNEKNEWERKPAEKPAPIQNAGSEQTKSVKFEDLTPEMQEDLVFARNAKMQKKNELIERLVANVEGDTAKAAQRDRLSKRSLADLEADAALIPATNEQATEQRQPYDFTGAGAGLRQVTNAQPTHIPLGIPVMDFTPAGKN